MSDVNETLEERGKRYGSFRGHALITQGLKNLMQDSEGWQRLDDCQREALEMIAHKIGRILNGDPNYADSWHDIAGYSKLVEDDLEAGDQVGAHDPSNTIIWQSTMRHKCECMI